MSVDDYVQQAVELRVEYLQKILRVTQAYGKSEKRQHWLSELNALKLWLDCRLKSAS